MRIWTLRCRRKPTFDCSGEIKASLVDLSGKAILEASREFQDKVEYSSEPLLRIMDVIRTIYFKTFSGMN
jgi:hypothetical protein